MQNLINCLVDKLEPLHFSLPVTHVYNPLQYAQAGYLEYVRRFARPPKKAVLLGMNPGPWGMAQTGVPFGEIASVRDWMQIRVDIGKPANEHAKRPVRGFDCTRGEISGKRLWGWAKERFKTPELFFKDFFVANYCPLMFMEESGRNRTPDKLKKQEKTRLFHICDHALRELMALLAPHIVIGVGKFAAQRASIALGGTGIRIGQMTHPSPANPKANRGWASIADHELDSLGIPKYGSPG